MKNDKYDNLSLDGKVGFIEDGHKYVMIDDPAKIFTSVTTLIKDYHIPFDADAVIPELITNPDSPYYGMDPAVIKQRWIDKGLKASGEGTILHAYGEALLKGLKVKPPNLPKAKWVPDIISDIYTKGYELAKAELLLYDPNLSIAGQSDIILKKKVAEDSYDYMIYDWKFLGKPLEKSSFYDKKTRKRKMMLEPFHHLQDCKWIHYSIQLAIYQALFAEPERILEKVLICVYDNSWQYVPAHPIRIFWTADGQLHTIYQVGRKGFYDSRTGSIHKKWPSDIPGR